MHKFYRIISLILCCVLALLIAGCGTVSLEKSLEKIAMDNGNFTNIDIHSSQSFYEVILDCVEYPTEEFCDDLAAKMFKKAYSKEYQNMDFEYIEILIGEDNSAFVNSGKTFERIAQYRLHRLAALNIDIENMDNKSLAKLSNKRYRAPGAPKWHHDEYMNHAKQFSVK